MCDTEHLLFGFELIEQMVVQEKANAFITKLWISQTVKRLENPQNVLVKSGLL